MYQQLILSFLIAILSLIILRAYDKFYNKQYTRKDYVNQFFLVLIASTTVLYVDNHFSNYNTTQVNKQLNLSPKIGGSSISQVGGTGNFKQFHQSTKPASVVETNIEKIKFSGKKNEEKNLSFWSGRRDSNPRLQPWQGCALPLSYARIGICY